MNTAARLLKIKLPCACGKTGKSTRKQGQNFPEPHRTPTAFDKVIFSAAAEEARGSRPGIICTGNFWWFLYQS
jgi:hypothetical protein